MLRKKIECLLKDIKALEASPSPENTLPQNTFYLNDREIVCYPRENGESRHPYDSDGLVVWARSSGYIEACESLFSIFKPVHFGEDPSVNFFAGIKQSDDSFFPVSILGVNRQLFEPFDVRRYVVYSLRCAYYIADTDFATFAVRLHVDKDKHIHFATVAINKSDSPLEFYLASYFEAILRYEETESFWFRMSKFGQKYENGSFILRSGDDSLVINKKTGGNITKKYSSVAKSAFLGYKGRMLTNALSLKTGQLKNEASRATTTEIPAASDIIHFNLSAGEDVRLEYDLSYCHNADEAEKRCGGIIDLEKIDALLADWDKSENSELDNLKVKFDGWKVGQLNSTVVNRFIRNVQKQISFCALGKNYAGPHIGIRDVFQQLESSLIWQPEKSRDKIVSALNYILADGRPPRQFSVPAVEGALPDLDLREYIDQGVWIISTVYTYLSYTGDYTILDEICSYYELADWGGVKNKSSVSDSVLTHLIKIMDYMASNIDREYGTNCLRVLFGDWNDALDGLGKTKDEGKRFGSGVTVMATLQFYQNCREIAEILSHVGGYEEKIAEYKSYADKIEEGLFKYALDKKGDDIRIIHGWGDKLSYKVGSFSDPDGVSRYSIAPNAFWAITGMVKKDPSLRKSIEKCLDSLDSKYGLKTFDKPFPYGLEEVGRISYITPGTYENSCAYVHASMFGIMALFCLGNSERAWREMVKSMVISHENASMTTFAMPNSYCCNPDWCIDGGSMGDWYTGSGTVLVKEIIKYGFGIAPDLDGLRIQTPKHMPSDKAEISVKVCGADVTLKYENKGLNEREIYVNGVKAGTSYDNLMGIPTIYIPKTELKDKVCIKIFD